MPTLTAQWTTAKSDLDKCKALFAKDDWAKIDKAGNLAAALKVFDKGGGYEAWHKAMLLVRASKTAYEVRIRAVMKSIEAAKKQGSPAYKALQKMEKALLAILQEGDRLAQPPRPGSGTVPYPMRTYNLAAGFKPKYLTLSSTEVNVAIQIDKALDELIKAGQENLKISYLGEVALAELSKAGDAFKATMQDIDGKIKDLDSDAREKKIKEANEVLKHYAKIMEDRANAAVEKEWQAYLARKQYLKDFRVACVVKIVLGTVGAAVSIASAALTFGALWMNVLAAAKALTSVAEAVKTFAQKIDSVYADLVKEYAAIGKLNAQREQAKQAGQGQKASKAGQAAKEVVTNLLPITRNMITASSNVEAKAKQLQALASKVEQVANTLTGQLNLCVNSMAKLPVKTPKAMEPDVAKLDKTFTELFAKISTLHQEAISYAKFGDLVMKEAQKLRKEDSWTGTAACDATNLGSRAASLYGLANFAVEAAKHGTTLLSMV
jgi:uncharacterized protein YifE (UPF0438 family)